MVPVSYSYTESLDCPVCLDIYRDPRMLPACGHSVCLVCVQQLIANSTSPGNVVCPECRAHSRVPANGVPRNYRLADIVATLEADGYRDALQCSGCRLQVPNRRLREFKTCATEDSIPLCAECALLRHKDHDLAPFNCPPAAPVLKPQVSRNASVQLLAQSSVDRVTIDESPQQSDDGERERQRRETYRQLISADDERNPSFDWRSFLKAVLLFVIVLLASIGFMAAVVFLVFICVVFFGEPGIVILLPLVFVPEGIGACCRHRRRQP